MLLTCKKTIEDIYGLEILFTEGKTYEFIPVDNKYAKAHNFVGYFVKDDRKQKRWCRERFKDMFFL